VRDNSAKLGLATGSDQRKRASRSTSPDSSSVWQTALTWLHVKLSVGSAKIGSSARGCGSSGVDTGELVGVEGSEDAI